MIISGIEKEKIGGHILKRYDELKSNRRVKEDLWLQCTQNYLSQFPEVWHQRAVKDARSARFMALSFDAVESNHSAIMSMLMPGDSWLGISPSVYGRLEYDDKAASQVKDLLLQQQEQIKFKSKMASLVKQAAIIGNAPYSVGWREDDIVDYPAYEQAMLAWQITTKEGWEQYNAEMELFDKKSAQAEEAGTPPPRRPSLVAPEPPAKTSELAYAGPSFEVGSAFDYLIDPYSPDPRHPLVFRRTWISQSELNSLSTRNKFGYAIYDNTENVHPVDRLTGPDSSTETQILNAFGLQAPPSDSIELIEAWGTIEIPSVNGGVDTYTSFVGAIANRGPLVRFEPTFMWSGKAPHGLCRYRDVPGQVYGIGALEPVLGLQDLINARVNQLIDIVSFSINQEFIGVDDGIIEDTFVSAPNRIHWAGNTDNLVPIRKDLGALNVAMSDLELLKQEFMRITKSIAPSTGSNTESATKTRQQGAAIGGDLGKIAAFIEDDTLSDIIDLMIELNVQYLDKGQAVRQLQDGQPVITQVSPEAVRKGWVCRVTGTRNTLDEQERLDKMLMFFQMVLGSPIMTSTVDVLALAKKVYEMFGFGDAGDIFNDEARANEIMDEMIRSGMIGNNAGQAQGQ